MNKNKVLHIVSYNCQGLNSVEKKEFEDTKGKDRIVSRKTDKTMVNKMKRKTNIEHTTLH